MHTWKIYIKDNKYRLHDATIAAALQKLRCHFDRNEVKRRNLNILIGIDVSAALDMT